MSQAVATPPPASTPRRAYPRWWDDPESRSTTIGVIGVVLIHLLLYFLGPYLLRVGHADRVFRPGSTTREFNIELAPEIVEEPTTVPPQQFVETNPDAPENTPDRTNNFAAQNQQVAQEKPTPDGDSERPVTEGKKDWESNQIVSGRLQSPEEKLAAAAALAESMPTPAAPAAPRAEQMPLPGVEKFEGDNPDGAGSNIAEASPNARPIPERVEGARDVPLQEGATGLQPAIDPKRPRQRPQLVQAQQQVRPAILAENKAGTRNIGVTAINAKFNDYGLYLQRLIDTVQMEFDRLTGAAAVYPPQGSYVVVKFALKSDGSVARIIDVENHTSTLGSQIAVSAITNRAPFGPWTETMKTVLNEEEELVFSFHYQ